MSFYSFVNETIVNKSFAEATPFAPPFWVNDIALLQLAEEVDLKVYTPVCLAETGLDEAGTNHPNIYLSFKRRL